MQDHAMSSRDTVSALFPVASSCEFCESKITKTKYLGARDAGS